MKSIYCLIYLSLLSLCLGACSPINSVHPFDDEQAAIIAKSMLPKPTKPR